VHVVEPLDARPTTEEENNEVVEEDFKSVWRPSPEETLEDEVLEVEPTDFGRGDDDGGYFYSL